MKIIFAGTPEFAATALTALLLEKHEILAVLTQPDRPAGRGMQMVLSPVKKLANLHNLQVLQPTTLKSEETQKQLSQYRADIMVVAAYGLILPAAVLHMPHYGCLNIHASLLPRWRGAAPIQRAILAGDATTGITIMQMDEGLDTGDMLSQDSCPIDVNDNAQTLHDKLAEMGAKSIVEALNILEAGLLRPAKQANFNATYAAKISKAESMIDWTQSSNMIERAIRAYNPYPGAHTLLNGAPIKIWQAGLAEGGIGEPGTVMHIDKNGIQVASGKGSLRLTVLQKPNAKALQVTQFIQGFKLKTGDRFTAV